MGVFKQLSNFNQFSEWLTIMQCLLQPSNQVCSLQITQVVKKQLSHPLKVLLVKFQNLFEAID